MIKTSSSKQNESNPVWNESFYFWIYHPEHECLKFLMEDEKTKSIVASLDLFLNELLNEKDMSIDKSFELKTMKVESFPTVHMKISLKVGYQLN